MSDLSYLHLPKPVFGEELLQQAQSLRELRLLSLQTDRSNFISRYEDEVDQPIQFTIDRVQDPYAEHFVAVAKSDSSKTNDTSTAKRYHAFLVMVRMDPAGSTESNTKEFSMAAVYVRPTYRGQGVCTKLIEESIKWASSQIQQTDLEKAVLSCAVAKSNLSAQRLYSKLGYNITSHEMEKNKAGIDIPIVRMELRLP